MKTHTAGICPMYLTQKDISFRNEQLVETVITCYHTEEISVGDIYQHMRRENEFTVSEIMEQRPANGNHSQPTTFYKLRLKR